MLITLFQEEEERNHEAESRLKEGWYHTVLQQNAGEKYGTRFPVLICQS